AHRPARCGDLRRGGRMSERSERIIGHGASGSRGVRAKRGASARGKLDLDPKRVRLARQLARRAGKPVVDLARSHTTVSVERAVLRLAGITGADPDGIPWVNRLVDAVVADVGLGLGVALPVFHALAASGAHDLTLLAQKAAAGSVRFAVPAG